MASAGTGSQLCLTGCKHMRLQQHSTAVQGDGDSFSKGFPILQLPVQQLASLRSLDLQHVTVTVQLQAGADTQTTPPNLPPELLGITSLRLWSAGVGLSTLSAFTNLQHLALTVDGDSSVELSSLPHLTHLHLGCAQDAVMASVSSLTSLQELEVEGDCTADGLAALPASLTKLCVRGKVTLAPDSTPAVAQLTALQWLEVDRAAGFSTAVLRSMSSLQHLAVRHTPLLSAQGVVDDDVWGVDLAPFSVLTQLQHLELPVGTTTEYAAADAETDVAALTASSQLTYLNIVGMVEQQHYSKMFPAGRQLSKLKELRATMGVLGTAEDAEALVRCCPNLEHLNVGILMEGEPVLEEYEGLELKWCSVNFLRELASLTRLTINVQEFECNEIFWRCMSNVTNLRDLHIRELDMSYFGGIVELASCQELTCLLTDCTENFPDFEMKTPEGQPPDIWRRLPQEALRAALFYYELAPNYEWNSEGALRSMARVAADHSIGLDYQLQQEVGELRATVATLENRLQQQDERLQQQDKQLQAFAGLQATVAAMGAQLQALLPQTNMQQG